MKLSQAIMLGDSLKKSNPRTWLSPDGSCGCAFGGALLAAGITVEQFSKEGWGNAFIISEMPCVKALWPWVTREIIGHISLMYHDVTKGTATIEQIADYVRQIEPAEEPDAEQERLEEEAAELEGALTEASGYPIPGESRF